MAAVTTVAAHLDRLAADCRRFPRAVVDSALPAIGAALVDTATATTQAAGGRMARYNRGAGVRLEVGGRRAGRDTVTLVPAPLGAWTIAQAGSRRDAWMIPAGAPARRPARRIRLASGGVRWWVRHGPVTGRRVWDRVLADVDDALPGVVHEATAQAWADLRGT